ncbi:MAG TPA: hypothetical protein VL614_14915 [Acetobacteraceae bacterium]|jgi:hypothetical protein|nr:hypothetical protein [Acetobacteraceae bacterium]
MAKSYLVPLNLNQNELQNARVQNLATAPASPVTGQGYYSTSTNAVYFWNGTAWVPADATKATGIPTTAIANFQSTIQAYPLSSFAAPTANIAMAGFTLTGLATPTASGQAAEYSWVIGRNLNTIANATATTANVPMGGFTFTGLATPTANGQAAEYSWVLSRALSSFTGANTANVPMNGFTLTGLPAPTVAGQAAEYSWVIGQVQSAAAGISSKPPVQCIATSNITLSGLQTIDGYTTVAGDRVLVVGQTTASANGVYNAASGAWTRTTVDGSAPGELETGALWLVNLGTVNQGSQWRLTTTGTIVVGTTSLTFVQFGAAAVYTAGNGLSLSGGQFSVNPVSGGGILVGPSGVSVDPTVVPHKFSQTIGDGTTTSFTITHSLGTQDVHMQVRQAASPFGVVECDMSATSTTTATIAFAQAPATNAYRVVIMG